MNEYVRGRGARWVLGLGLAVGSALVAGVTAMPAQTLLPGAATPAGEAASQGPGTPFTAIQVNTMLPQTVWFAGKSAPLQLRNAGGTKFANGTLFWVGLVDTSGYSTSVQDRYQFYFVTEGPVRVGDATLQAGAYGGGFVGDRFTFMDLGDHTLAQGAVQTDAGLHRPRPLQVVADRPDAVKLYLGRKWVTIEALAATSSH